MRNELQHGLLTHDDEVQLAKAIEVAADARDLVAAGAPLDDHLRSIDGGERARRRFIESNVRLVWSMAAKFSRPNHVELEDVYQDGLLGLHTAVDRYDWTTGYRFSTYATWWIRQAMQRGLENTGSTIRIPAEVRGAVLNESNTDEGGREKAARRALAVDSIDRPLGGDEFHISDTLIADGDVAEDVSRRVIAESVVELLGSLDGSTRSMLIRRFGLDGGEPESYQSIADDVGLSAPAVRKRILKAIESIRDHAGLEVAA